MRSFKFCLSCIVLLLLSTSVMAGVENVFEGKLTIKNNTSYTVKMTDDRMEPDRGKFTFDLGFINAGKQITPGAEKYIGEGKSERNKNQGQFTFNCVDTDNAFILKYRFGEKGDDSWARVEHVPGDHDGWLPKIEVSMSCSTKSTGFLGLGNKYKHTCTLTLSEAPEDTRDNKEIEAENAQLKRKITELEEQHESQSKRIKLLDENQQLKEKLATLEKKEEP